MGRICPNCGKELVRRFAYHLKICANMTEQEYTNLMLFGDKTKTPKCVICGKDAYYNINHYHYYDTCKTGNCAKILALRTRVNNGTHNFLSNNRLKSDDGKDIIGTAAAKTRLINGTCSFSKNNRNFDNKRICTNLAKYGTSTPTNFWYRTEYNNNPCNELYLSDESIESHNIEVTKNRRLNQLKLINIGRRSNCELFIESLLIKSGYKFDIQYRDSNWDRQYTCDFIISDTNLIIEVDGDFKLDESGNFYQYYIDKYNYIKSKGYKVINIMQHEVYNYTVQKLIELINSNLSSTTIERLEKSRIE